MLDIMAHLEFLPLGLRTKGSFLFYPTKAFLYLKCSLPCKVFQDVLLPPLFPSSLLHIQMSPFYGLTCFLYCQFLEGGDWIQFNLVSHHALHVAETQQMGDLVNSRKAVSSLGQGVGFPLSRSMPCTVSLRRSFHQAGSPVPALPC